MNVSGPVRRYAIAHNIAPEMEVLLRDRGLEPANDRIPKGLKWAELAAFLSKGEGAEGIITRTGVFLSDEVLRACDQLRFAISASRNPDFDQGACMEHGVWALRSDANTDFVAARTNNNLSALADGTLQSVLFAHEGNWDKSSVEVASFNIRDCVLGILGFGEIGKKVAKYAKDKGMQVIAFNDGNGKRNHDEGIELAAESLGVRMTKSMEELLGASDIVTIHINDESWDRRSNNGVVTREMIEQIGASRRSTTMEGVRLPPRVLVNYARAEVMQPSLAEVAAMINQGGLEYYMVDVFGKKNEAPGAFASLMHGVEGNARYRIIPTLHSLGSGSEIERAAALHIARKLIPAAEGGYLRKDQSLVFPRHTMDHIVLNPGDLHVTLVTSTTRGVVRTLEDLFLQAGLDLIDDQKIRDSKEGTDEKYPLVHRTFGYGTNGKEDDYPDLVQEVVEGLAEINKGGEHRIVAVRFIPTSGTQEEALASMTRWTSNMREI